MAPARVRAGVGVQFGFWLSLLGLAAIGVTALYAYSQAKAMLIGAARDRLVTTTTVLGRRLSVALDEIGRDVTLMTRLEEIGELVQRPADPAPFESRLAAIFAAVLDLHPEYLQLRFIGADDFGRERVRVDRTGQGTARVTGSELQEKGHFSYVYRTLAQPSGTFYLSEINLNLERGVRFGLNRPTLRLATPVHTASGEAFGLVIVNVALNGLFAQLRADLPHEMELYLTNADGDYLLHPDAAKTFGFDLGRRIRIQDDVGEAATVLERRAASTVVERDGRVAAFVDVPFGPIAPDRRVLLGLAVPTTMALHGLGRFAERLALLVLGFGVVAVAASFLLSQRLVRPLDRVAHALDRFSHGQPLEALPVTRNDEIGMLSRSAAAMASQIGAQLETLRVAERNLHRILEAAPSGMVIEAKDDHRILFMNTSAGQRFRADGERTVHPILDALDAPDAQALYEQLARAGKVDYAEHRLHVDDGDAFWALLSMVDIEYRGRAAVLVSVVDITQRKAAEIELDRYRNALEALVEERTAALRVAQRESLRNERLAAIGQITGTVSHELRNPLGTIHTSFALLRSLVDSGDARVARAMERIDRNIERCDKIIQELLDYTRMRDLAPQETEIDGWLRRLMEEQELPPQVRLELALESGARAPIDRDRMAQAVINVVQNACQAMSDPGAPSTHRLTVRTRSTSDRLEMSFEDTGCGIDAADRARIFEPLFSTRAFGVGLGLPHVKQVLDLHHGGVEVHGEPGAGTRIVLWLPRAPG